jgi:hypothetical protein
VAHVGVVTSSRGRPVAELAVRALGNVRRRPYPQSGGHNRYSAMSRELTAAEQRGSPGGMSAELNGADEFAALMLEWAAGFGLRRTRRFLLVLQSQLLTRLQPTQGEWEPAPEVRPIEVSVDSAGRLLSVKWARYAPAQRIPIARPSYRASRRRNSATRRARARSPGSTSSDDDPHLEVVPISRFRRDVAVGGSEITALPKIATPEQSTSQALRLRVVKLLAASNGHGKAPKASV